MIKTKTIPLKKKLLNLLLWRLIAPTALLGCFIMLVFGFLNLETYHQNQFLIVVDISSRLNETIRISNQAITGLANLAESEPASLPVDMQAVYYSNSLFSTISHLDENGNLINSIPEYPSKIETTLLESSFLSSIQSSNHPYYSSPQLSPFTGKEVINLVIRLNNSQLLVAEIPVEKFQALIDYKNWNSDASRQTVFISDKFGNILVHTDPSLDALKANINQPVQIIPGIIIPWLVTINNRIYLSATKPADEIEWSVFTQTPLSQAIRPLIISGTFFLVALLSLWGSIVSQIRRNLLSEVSEPLSNLEETIKFLSSGDFSSPTFPLNPPNKILEIQTLTENFQEMSRAIQIRQSALIESRQQAQNQQILADALRDSAGILTSTLNFDEVLSRILSNVGKVVPHDFSYILLIEEDGDTVRLLAQKGVRPEGHSDRAFENVNLNISGTPTLKKMFDAGNPLVISDTLLEPGWPVVGETAWIQSYAAAPIKVNGQIIGFINLNSKTPGFYSQTTTHTLKVFADQAGIALNNARMLGNLEDTYEKTILGWSKALELRDNETKGHTNRVVKLTERLAKRLGIDEPELTYIRYGCLLHDIGKIGIPDSILLKQDSLTQEEWEIMKKHPVFAYEILSPIPYLKNSVDIPYCHHEKWDGSGYPRGLKGDQIPFSARIFAILDVWDGLVSQRPYHEPWPQEKVIEHIRNNSGKHFDPHLVLEFYKFYIEELIPEMDAAEQE